jgi:flagellar motor switch protein FliN/FliY
MQYVEHGNRQIQGNLSCSGGLFTGRTECPVCLTEGGIDEELIGEGGPPEKVSMDLLRDVTLDLKIELGRTRLSLEEILQLRRGSVVTLDKLAGDPVDIYVNGRLVARGEVLVLNDNFCVRVAELIGSDSIP